MSRCQVSLSPQRDVAPRPAGLRRGGTGSAKTWFRVAGLGREIRVKIASEVHELEQAYGLLAANYRARGYEAASDKPYRFTPFHALPGTVTLIALHHDRVLATLTLVPDSDILGLPMETIYGPEVAQLRQDGLRPSEAISLADTDLTIREFIQVFKALIRLGMQYNARSGGDNCWIITVNPRHSSFYQKVLGFTPLGPQRSYPTVQNHPAEAYVLTPTILAANAPQMHQEIFGDELPEPVLTAGRWSAEHVRYFGARSSQLDERDLDTLLTALNRPECPSS